MYMSICAITRGIKCQLTKKNNNICCSNNKIGSWCWNKTKSKKTPCKKMKQNMRCRLVKGSKETCCINPLKGHWCWSRRTQKKVSDKMIRNCCLKTI